MKTKILIFFILLFSQFTGYGANTVASFNAYKLNDAPAPGCKGKIRMEFVTCNCQTNYGIDVVVNGVNSWCCTGCPCNFENCNNQGPRDFYFNPGTYSIVGTVQTFAGCTNTGQTFGPFVITIEGSPCTDQQLDVSAIGATNITCNNGTITAYAALNPQCLNNNQTPSTTNSTVRLSLYKDGVFKKNNSGNAYQNPFTFTGLVPGIYEVKAWPNSGPCSSHVTTEEIEVGPVWYRDFDGDGFGDPDIYHFSCIPPVGYVSDDQDCADLIAQESYNPNTVWYQDEDEDGFYGATATQCERPEGDGWSNAPNQVGGDTNDQDDSIHPDTDPCTGACDTDDDGDGFTEEEGDCSDDDINVFPSITITGASPPSFKGCKDGSISFRIENACFSTISANAYKTSAPAFPLGTSVSLSFPGNEGTITGLGEGSYLVKTFIGTRFHESMNSWDLTDPEPASFNIVPEIPQSTLDLGCTEEITVHLFTLNCVASWSTELVLLTINPADLSVISDLGASSRALGNNSPLTSNQNGDLVFIVMAPTPLRNWALDDITINFVNGSSMTLPRQELPRINLTPCNGSVALQITKQPDNPCSRNGEIKFTLTTTACSPGQVGDNTYNIYVQRQDGEIAEGIRDAGYTANWFRGSLPEPVVADNLPAGFYIYDIEWGACRINHAGLFELPAISANPPSVTIAPSGNTTFVNCNDGTYNEFRATPASGYIYTWYKNGNEEVLKGFNESVFGKHFTVQDAGNYQVVIEGIGCIAPSPATRLSVTENPIIRLITQGNPNICRTGQVTIINVGTDATTYQWYRFGVVIPGANAKSYVATEPGDYQIEVGFGDCATTGFDNVISISGCRSNKTGDEETIEEATEALHDVALSAYPNPFNDLLNVEFTLSQDSRIKLEIFNVAGQRLANLFEGKVKAGEVKKVEYKPAINCNCVITYRLITEKGSYYGKAVMVR